MLDNGLFATGHPTFDVALLNPPYKKFGTASRVRHLLRRLDIETSNLYTAFLSLAVLLLDTRGELIAITPRSFCNGPYFRAFRQHLLCHLNLTWLHIFESRDRAFRDDEVLQENVILRAIKGEPQQPRVRISQSCAPEAPIAVQQDISFERVVRPDDPQMFIRLAPEQNGQALAEKMERLPCTLADLGVSVSTGRVVDFRARQWLCVESAAGAAPLIYPAHFDHGVVRWPKTLPKKAAALQSTAESAALLVPAGVYTLVKRLSAKEERRRLVSAIFDPQIVPCEAVGFENHLNYFHAYGEPLDRPLAWGLCLFLNSSTLDRYFRQFNGHTQVNATDLRSLRYPTKEALRELGQRAQGVLPTQHTIDLLLDEVLRA